MWPVSQFLYFRVILQQLRPEIVFMVLLQLTCQGHPLLLSLHVVLHRELMGTQTPKNSWERTFRMSAKGGLGLSDVCLLQGTSPLTSRLRSSGFWSRWITSGKRKPHKETDSSSKHEGWLTLAWCPGCKWQEGGCKAAFGCIGKAVKGNSVSSIPLPDFCQYRFNARTLNLPTFSVYLLDLINGQTHFSPLI